MTWPPTFRNREPRCAGGRRLLFDLVITAVVMLAGTGVYAIASAADRAPSYDWKLPKGFPQPRVPQDDPMTQAKVDVGRRLFYDARLSGNGTQSCSSCHLQALAFSDGRTTAVGSTGQVHPRNSPSLVNVAYLPTLTWANPSLVSLEGQMLVPIFGTSPVELGVTDANKPHVLARIAKDPWYKRHFKTAFPAQKTPVNWTTIVDSIASFQRSIISANSRYDRYLAGTSTLSKSQTRGMNIFMGERGECSHCHGSFIFNDQTSYRGAPLQQPQFHNDALYNVGGTGAYPAGNRGLFELTGNPADMGKFKAPSLRNVALTAPYMHDGSIATLKEVVAHYARGGRDVTNGPDAGDGATSRYRDPILASLKLTARDQADLVAFLGTLTDRTVTTSKRFADPFAKTKHSATTPAGR